MARCLPGCEREQTKYQLSVTSPFDSERATQLERHTRRINNPQHRLLAELPLVLLCSLVKPPRRIRTRLCQNQHHLRPLPHNPSLRVSPLPSRIEHRQPIRKARCNRIRQKRPPLLIAHPLRMTDFRPKNSRYSSYRSLPSGQGISAGDGAHAANANTAIIRTAAIHKPFIVPPHPSFLSRCGCTILPIPYIDASPRNGSVTWSP